MKVCIFEWLVAGGGIGDWSPRDNRDPMLIQGAAMLSAITDDLLDSGHEIYSLIDPRWESALPNLARWRTEKRYVQLNAAEHIYNDDESNRPTAEQLMLQLLRASTRCEVESEFKFDSFLVIAPESEGILASCASALESKGRTLVTGDTDFIALCSDKNQTQRWLEQADVAVPVGQPVSHRGDALAFVDRHAARPVVVKPAVAAGSEDVRVVCDRTAVENLNLPTGNWRVEQFVDGMPVSVIVARRGETMRMLPATGQVFENEHSLAHSDPITNTAPLGDVDVGHYCGTIYPLDSALTKRAQTLAMQTARTLPDWHGMIGIDMILSESDRDVVVDVNPRLTMSWTALPKPLRREIVHFLFGDG